ncbi:hypothetical protein TCAL_09231 [Tigriopus californicus]|uniref:Profilin n=1 Tax=Tigriopus californicus TaxID=6832 RepID=A0A553NQ01_TIGCA|nr:profilin-like [Tigriopus californicus]TRY67490.1 hypothetical protein TCAL_09231 [Tigriopus californicus]
MSWQSYVDDQLIATGMIKKAVICGHDGNIWAQTPGFNVTQAELSTLISKYTNTEELALSGVTIAGVRYMFLSNTDKVIRAKKGTSGIHTIKTTQALILCVYEDPIVPEQAATVTEKLGEYLISMGY